MKLINQECHEKPFRCIPSYRPMQLAVIMSWLRCRISRPHLAFKFRLGVVQGWAGAGVGIGMALVVGNPSIEIQTKLKGDIDHIFIKIFKNS